MDLRVPALTFSCGAGFSVEVVEITLLYFDDCPNWTETDGHLAQLQTEYRDLAIARRLVNTPEEAEQVEFRGSPSVLVDGIDPFADPDAPIGLSCRIYQTPGGPAGSPTIDQLRSAIEARV